MFCIVESIKKHKMVVGTLQQNGLDEKNHFRKDEMYVTNSWIA